MLKIYILITQLTGDHSNLANLYNQFVNKYVLNATLLTSGHIEYGITGYDTTR